MELLQIDFFSFAIIFFIYCFIGWFYESTLYSIVEQRRFMNRGYFLGPYCPIYGVVIISAVYFLQDIESHIKVMIMGALLVTFIEYVTSYTLEKLFDARYWDYSEYPLNINGRVSVISSIFFGFTTMFGVKTLHPFLEDVVGKIPEKYRIITAIAMLVIFVIDGTMTTVSMCNLNKKCKEIYEQLNAYVDSKFEDMTDKSKFLDENVTFDKVKIDVSVKLQGMTKRFKESEMHVIRAFPYFRSTKYNDLIQRIKVTSRLKLRKNKKE